MSNIKFNIKILNVDLTTGVQPLNEMNPNLVIERLGIKLCHTWFNPNIFNTKSLNV